MEIKYLDNLNTGRWDVFVDSHPDATFFHKSGWKKVIENSFGHKTYFLYAEKDGVILGLLPLGHVKSYLFGNSLISTPFCVYGGTISVNEQARLLLENAACQLARDLHVDYLELRNIQSSVSGRPSKQLYVTFRKQLLADHENNFLAIPRKQRAMIKKGMLSELTSVIDSGVDRFYDAYAESVRNLGTPVLGKHYFQNLLDIFGKDCEIMSIEHKGRVVSSVMSFYFRDVILPYYGGGSLIARGIYANDFMYWELMKLAVDRGILVFDFGRSKYGTGSYRFKTHWGFVPMPLCYEYELISSKTVPDINPLNPRYKYFVSAWKCLPLRISKIIGPYISRNIG